MEAAASRLLRVLDERVRKRRLAGGLEGPAEIQDRPLSPDENAEERSHMGSGRLDAPPQLTQPREDGCDPVASKGFSGNGLEFDGRADLSTLDFVRCVNPEGTARPSLDEPPVKDRAVTRSRDF